MSLRYILTLIFALWTFLDSILLSGHPALLGIVWRTAVVLFCVGLCCWFVSKDRDGWIKF